ncbi:hypothetical protein ACFL12_01280 [Pseudomonadota bacterium]
MDAPHSETAPNTQTDAEEAPVSGAHPSSAQQAWLTRGLEQAGGKLPLFDEEGQQVCERTVRVCIDKGWAEPWFSNPLKPDWIVCKLTDAGRAAVGH